MSDVKTYEVNNTGIYSHNDYKQKDSHPIRRGRAKVGGIWYWVSGWEKAGSKGPFDSLAFTEMTQDEADKYQAQADARNNPQPQQRQQAQPQQQAQQSNPNAAAQNPDGTPHQSAQPPMDFDDDIPF